MAYFIATQTEDQNGTDYPMRIVILSERSEPKDLSSYPMRIVILSERSESKDLFEVHATLYYSGTEENYGPANR